MKGTVNENSFKSILYKKFYNSLQGKNTSEITIERLVMRKIKDSKKEKLGQKYKTDEKMIFKYKKEPEKNKTHWDSLLDEMVSYCYYWVCLKIIIIIFYYFTYTLTTYSIFLLLLEMDGYGF